MNKTVLILGVILSFLACKTEVNKEKITENTSAIFIEKQFELSENETFAQQLIVNCNENDLKQIDSFVNWAIEFQPGGLSFTNWDIEDIQALSIRFDTIDFIKPLFIANFFETIEERSMPIWASNKTFQDSIYFNCFKQSGIDWIEFDSSAYNYPNTLNWFDKLNKSNTIRPVYGIQLANYFKRNLKGYINLTKGKKRVIKFDSPKVDSLPIEYLKRATRFNGLIIVKSNSSYHRALNGGADMVEVKNRDLINQSDWIFSVSSVNSAKKILEYKSSLNKSKQIYNANAQLKYTKYNYIAKSTVLLRNKNKLVPSAKINTITWNKFIIKGLPSSKANYIIEIPSGLDLTLIDSLISQKELKRILVVFSVPSQYRFLKSVPNLCYRYKGETKNNKFFEAQINGGLPISGSLVFNQNKVKGILTKAIRISDVAPEYIGADSEKMAPISGYVNQAIAGRAFPGCQVIALKKGVIIYSKSFGTADYDQKNPVNQQKIYDLASLTKVVSTTLIGMKLYESGYYDLQDSLKQYLPDTLNKYVPSGSHLKHTTFQELFIHKSGLPSGFPIIEYMRKAADLDTRFDTFYCDYNFENFDIEVAENLYLGNQFEDSMWLKLHKLNLNPEKSYVYSDVNMNVLYLMFKSMLEKESSARKDKKGKLKNSFEVFLYKTFYQPLGMKKTVFNPRKLIRKEDIVPTENERFWRKQLLQGYVHDPNAALFGGVAGNAGIFSNTNELAILCQMLLNKGVYNNKRYLESSTIEKFIATQPGSHRGLGFNKRTITNSAYAMADSADISTYGHTGFTGTCFWIDPENELIYIFLSNRVHPKITNKIYEYKIRKRIHQVFYDAMMN